MAVINTNYKFFYYILGTNGRIPNEKLVNGTLKTLSLNPKRDF